MDTKFGTNLGMWDNWYCDIKYPSRYGDAKSYKLGAAWLKDCKTVEDWGCGKGWFKHYRPDSVGIDGSKTPFTNIVVDLREYRSSVEGIFMRHVLEHDYNWEKILDNALLSFTKKMVLIIFTPLQEGTKVIAENDMIIGKVPDIGFDLQDILNPISFHGSQWQYEQIKSKTQYGHEHIFYLRKLRK